MMSNSKVSVVIPAYNHEKYVGEAIQSVLDQTFQDFELIIINDGSTDNTEAEILKFKDDRIRYYSQENRGLSATLNRGIELARGEYFNFLPSDDAFLPEKLAIQWKAFEESRDIGIVFSYHIVVDGEGKEVKDDPIVDWFNVPFETKEEIFPALFERDFLSAPSALIKMECFKKVGPFDESLRTAQDYDLWIRVLKYYDLRLIKKSLLKLRWHGANLTYRTTPETERERAKVLLNAYKNLTIEDIFPSLHYRKDSLAYAEAYEKLATYMEKSGISALLPISQIYKDRGRHLTERKEDIFLFKKGDKAEGGEEYYQSGFRGDAGKIHLLIETRSLDKGGLEEVVYGIVTHLDPDLFLPVVVCIEAGGFTADRIRKTGIPVEVLGGEKEKEYFEILNQYRIDLVNTHYSFFGSAIAYRMGIPVISVLHSIYSWYPGTILDEFRSSDKYVSKYIAVSNEVASFAKYRFNVDQKRIRVIPDGIDIDRFGDKKNSESLIHENMGLHKDDFVFLHVGAINPAKMHNLLVAVMREISKAHPKVKLLCIGPVLNEEYYHFILKKIEEYGLDQYMKVVGFVENPGAYYHLANAFVLPSLIEGWGIATLEAMYHGLPLILTRVGGAEELVKDRDIGILVDNCCGEVYQLTEKDWDYYSHLDSPENTPALVKAMLEIYEHQNEWKKKAQGGKQKVLAQYTWQNIILQYEKEFIALVLRGKKSREISLSELLTNQRGQLEELKRRLEDQVREFENQRSLFEEQSRTIQTQTTMISDQFLLTNHGLKVVEDRLNYVLFRLSFKERVKGLIVKLENRIKALFRYGALDYLKVRHRADHSNLGDQIRGEEDFQEETIARETQIEKLKNGELNSYGLEKQGFSIICLPIIDWDFRFQRPQQILSKFAEDGHRVFYIKTRLIPKESKGLSKRDVKNSIKIEEIIRNVYQVPLVSHNNLNIYRDVIEDKTDLEYLKESIEILKEKAQIDNILFYVNLPFWFPLVKLYLEEPNVKIVYDCMDYHRGFSTNTHLMVDQEDSLSRLSHLLITSSKKLCHLQRKLNPHTILVQNGTDFDHFNRLEPNHAMSKIGKPIIGYYGAISDWFDMDLIKEVAISRPDWNFVLIGHTFGAKLEGIEGIPNIHLLGEKNYEELPLFLYHFDVCTIPFKVNELTEATNPVKVYEYLSAGKPVVVTKLPELEEYSPYIYIAEDHHDFAEKLGIALNEKDVSLEEKRINFAKGNDWSQRYRLIHREIMSLYKKVSIIVVSYNNLAYLKLCLEGIFEYSNYPSYEVIVVDNGSRDGSTEYLRGKKEEGKIEVILNPENLGFAIANNQGIEISSGEYIILLNDDVVVTQNWISGLLSYLDLAGVGMVGPVTNEIGNEAKIETAYSSIDEMRKWSRDYTRKHKNEYLEMKMLALFCVAFKRSLLNEIGLLDERFEVGMFEDDDFSLRVKKAGYKTICAEDVFIHHFGKVSFKKMEEQEYRKLFDRNRQLFENKWNTRWEPHKYRD